MFCLNENFDKLLDTASRRWLMEPDWSPILDLCNLIRQKDVDPKTALNSLNKRLFSQDQHTASYALVILDNMVKNCGNPLHEELTTPLFCSSLYEMVKTTPHENVRQKLLELIQVWNFAFRNNPKHSALKDTMMLMKSDGFKFPAFFESDAMFSTDSPLEWADRSVCQRCRMTFGQLLRKYHCHDCGKVFCDQCSQESTTLPQYGIKKEVRVCDSCYDHVTKPDAAHQAAAEKQENELLQFALTPRPAVNEELRACIHCEGFPQKPLADAERLALLRQLEEATFREKQETAPTFGGFHFHQGALFIDCENKQSMSWLKTTVAGLRMQRVSLLVTPAKDIPKMRRATVIVRGLHREPEVILSALEKRNPGLGATGWHLLDSEWVRSNVNRLVVGLWDVSIRVLETLDFQPFYGLGRATVRLLDKEDGNKSVEEDNQGPSNA